MGEVVRLRATQTAYGEVARLLHWLVAAFVVALLATGLIMTRLEGFSPAKFDLYQWHKSFGFTVLVLMLVRVVWRLRHAPPPLPATMPAWARLAAHATHGLLYVLLLGLPLTGWAMVSASPLPIPTLLYKVLPVPHLWFLAELPAADKESYSHLFMQVHEVLGKIVLVLVAVHVAAALKHHFIDKDDILTRMLPGLGGKAARPAKPAGRKGPTIHGLLAALGGLALAALALPVPARASDLPAWTLDAAASHLRFEASAQGQTVPGEFKAFAAIIRFDPASPAAVDIAIEIDVASASAGNSQVDDTLKAADWLDAAGHAKATYRATTARQTGEGAYELQGELTLKGVTRSLPLPFTLTLAGDTAKVAGSLVLDRTQFGVGQGEAAAAVAPEVKIILDLTAKRA